MKIGIFGGTFSPVHDGHIGVAKEMLKYVDKVIFAITEQNPFKKEPPVNFMDRFDMIQKALKGCGTDMSIFVKETPKYMIDLLRPMVESESYKDDTISIIVGRDAYNSMNKWKDYEWIMNNVDIYVYRRGGENNDIPESYPSNVHFVQCDNIWNYSSSEMRKKLSEISSSDLENNNKHIEGMSKLVESYIGKNKLYRKEN